MTKKTIRQILLAVTLLHFWWVPAYADMNSRSLAYDCDVKGNTYWLLATNSDKRFLSSPIKPGADGVPEISTPTMGRWFLGGTPGKEILILHIQSTVESDGKSARIVQRAEEQAFAFTQDEATADVLLKKFQEGSEGQMHPVNTPQPIMHCVRSPTQDGQVADYFDRLPASAWH